MNPSDLASDLRRRINPAYSNMRNTESYERRMCVEAIEALLSIQETLKDDVASLRTQRDYLVSAAWRTLDENGHLADGENCTLIALKVALRNIGAPWAGDN